MTTYEQDLAKANTDLKRWQRKLMLARTKCRKLKAKSARLYKLVTLGFKKKKRIPGWSGRCELPVIPPEI